MAKFHYALVLLFIAVCAVGVNAGFRLKISRYWRVFLATDAVILAMYTAWDVWAIENHNWRFDSEQIVRINIFGILPIEEILFFVIVPLITVLTYLALKKLSARYGRSVAR